jgi:hypothetical protein
VTDPASEFMMKLLAMARNEIDAGALSPAQAAAGLGAVASVILLTDGMPGPDVVEFLAERARIVGAARTGGMQ